MSGRLGRKGLQDIASVAGAIYRPLLSFSQCFGTSNHVLGNLGWWKVRLITVSINEASQVSGGAAHFVWSFNGFEILWNILEIFVLGDREGRFCCVCFHIGQADVAVAAQSKLQLSIDIQILQQELHFIGREAASKQAARCRWPAGHCIQLL